MYIGKLRTVRFRSRIKSSTVGAVLGVFAAPFFYGSLVFHLLDVKSEKQIDFVVDGYSVAMRHGDLTPYFSNETIKRLTQIEAKLGPIVSFTLSGDGRDRLLFDHCIYLHVKRSKRTDEETVTFTGDYDYSVEVLDPKSEREIDTN